MIGKNPPEGVMLQFGHALNDALITIRSYRFIGPVRVLLEEMHDPQAIMFTEPSTPKHWLKPHMRYVGQAEYVVAHVWPGEDGTGFAPEFALDFGCLMATDVELPKIPPPVIEGRSRPLILQGEVLRQSFLGVQVPVTVTVRFDAYDVAMRRPGAWHVTAWMLPEETFTGRVTGKAWLAAALDMIRRRDAGDEGNRSI